MKNNHNSHIQSSVTFFVKSFPVLSQTFVIQQAKGLVALGHQVNVIALSKAGSFVPENDPVLSDLASNTKFLLDNYIRPRTLLGCVLGIAKLISKSFRKPKILATVPIVMKLLLVKREAYEAHQLIWLANHAPFIACGDVLLAHFGDMGVVANSLKRGGILTGRQYTIVHGYDISVFKKVAIWGGFYPSLAKNSVKILPISELWSSRLQKLGVPKRKLQVHHMGVETSQFSYSEKTISTPLKVLSVARATEKKGMAFAIEAVLNCKCKTELSIIGGGKLHDQLVEQANAIQSSNNINFLGPQPHDVVARELSASDVFLLPSITDSTGDMEGIPVSLMEAMASGVLVIATRHSGIPELIEDGVTGLLVPEKDPNAIAQCLERISNGDLNVVEIRKAARRKVESDFNSTVLNKQLSLLLDNLSDD